MTEDRIRSLFSANLRHLRQRERYTQEELSKILRVSVGILRHYEAGRVLPGYILMTAISRYFKLTVDDLLLIDLKTKEVGV